MTLISKLKSLLGLDAGGRDRGGTRITVERDPQAESERAVKESPGPSSAAEPEPTDDAETTEEAELEMASGPTDLAETVQEAEPEPAVGEAAEGRDEPVDSLSGIGPTYAERLNEAGVETVGDLAAADAAELAAATDLGESRLVGWIEQAKRA